MLEDSRILIDSTEVKPLETNTSESSPGSIDTIGEGDPDTMIGTGVDNESQHVTSGNQGCRGRLRAPQED